MERRRLGANGPEVSAIGLGCLGMSDWYGPADEAESVATIQAALDAGINHLDTGDFYGVGHNETLIGRAIRGRRDKVFVAVKFGALRDPHGAFIGIDTRPKSIRNYLAYSLKRLGTDYIDLYQPTRVDFTVSIEETIGTIADLVKAGWVRYIGVSEFGPTNIRRAHAVHPIVAVQAEYSLMSRGIEAEILPTVRKLGIGLVAYGVLGSGLLSGRITSEGVKDFRADSPYFQGKNLAANLKLVARLAKLAEARGRTPSQFAIAWVLSRGNDVIPIIGARRRESLSETLGALELKLAPEEIAAIEAAVPAKAVAGTRYNDSANALFDEERRSVTLTRSTVALDNPSAIE